LGWFGASKKSPVRSLPGHGVTFSRRRADRAGSGVFLVTGAT
jgi:hypothetical protein